MYPRLLDGITLRSEAPDPGSDAPFRSERPTVTILFVILIMALFGLGFLNALWWAAAAALIFAAVYYGRGQVGSRRRRDEFEYRDYQEDRDRAHRWDRRYRRRRRGLWRREDRRDEQHHG